MVLFNCLFCEPQLFTNCEVDCEGTFLIRENIQHKSRYWHINGFIYSEQIIPGYSLSVNTSQQSIITYSPPPHLGHRDQVIGENNTEDNQLTLISIDGQFYRLWWYSTYHKQYQPQWNKDNLSSYGILVNYIWIPISSSI